jgi:hypothetical protein
LCVLQQATISLDQDSNDVHEARTVITNYNDRDKPTEILYYGRNGGLLCRKTLAWDAADLLMREERLIMPGFELPTDSELENLADALGRWVITYSYDQNSRCREQVCRLGSHVEIQTSFIYDSHDNPTERIDVTMSENRAETRHSRYDYAYDDRGNWTERVISQRKHGDSEFQRSSVERRMIVYYTE